jgi:hypothetical protein
MTAVRRPQDNRAALVRAVTRGVVSPPRLHPEAPRHDRDGRVCVLPGTGGIHPDVHVGDLVDAWLADHLMVGASIEDAGAAPTEPGALHLLTCVGNRVRDASGAMLGVVAGKRGGLAPGFFPPNLVAVEAPAERLHALVPGAAVFVDALGRGLELPEWAGIEVLNCAPSTLDALPLRVTGARLEIDVRLVVPSAAAGSGVGQDAWIGDLEIGDLVAFTDIDGRFGRFYRPGVVSVGLVAHGPSPAPGHGIGVTILLSGRAEAIQLRTTAGATLAPYLRRAAAEA